MNPFSVLFGYSLYRKEARIGDCTITVLLEPDEQGVATFDLEFLRFAYI
jgi:hypothetical protein